MNSESQRGTERLAKISQILGTISFVLILFPVGLFLWSRILGQSGDDFSLLGWAVLAVFMMLGSVLSGVPGFILALVALNRNKQQGENATIKNIANTGLVFSLVGILGTLVILGFAWVDGFSNPNPAPNPLPPKPTTTVP
jgi:hypothetical protein